MNPVGNFLFTILWMGGLGGAALFITVITVVIRDRRREGVAQQQLRESTAAAHMEHRDRMIVRQAIDEVAREDVKAAILEARVDAS